MADDENYHAKAAELLAKFYTFNSQYHPGPPLGSDHDGYCAAAEAHKGFMVPWRTKPGPGPGPHRARESVRMQAQGGRHTMTYGDPMEAMSDAEAAAFIAGGGV
eukprot:COSAG01_NODE_1873_length_8995_cov_7.542299_5_plen_104_part_00